MNNEYTKSLNNFMFRDALDLSVEYAELSIDSIIENEAFKSIPFVKTFLGIGKLGMSIRDFYMVEKYLGFINGFNAGELNAEEIEKHRKVLEKSPKKASQELGFITLILDHFNEVGKSVYCGKLYKAYISQEYGVNWNDFVIYSEALSKISLFDLEQLKRLYYKDIHTVKSKYKVSSMARLNAIGLIRYFSGTYKMMNGKKVKAKMRKDGITFCKIIFD